MLELNKIYLMDCMEGMKLLDDKSVDLIITSPPYNLGEQHHTGNNRFNSYNTYSDNIPEKEYQTLQLQMLNECYRVLKNNGSMFYNHKNRITKGKQITPYEWLLKSNFIVKQELVWFNGSQNFDKIRFYPMTERVYWLSKEAGTKLYNAINHHDVFDWKPVCTKGEHKRAFPKQFVLDMLACFPEAKTVLDPYIGSGTTAIACLNTNRQYIGFELDEDYYNAATERLEAVKSRISIFDSEPDTTEYEQAKLI